MRIDKFCDDRINYQESCFIVNAMDFYIANFKANTNLSKESIQYYNDIIIKYHKLENQILNLRIKENVQKNEIDKDRKKEIFNNLIEYVCEHCEDEKEEYNIFKNVIGLTDEEMEKLGLDFKI